MIDRRRIQTVAAAMPANPITPSGPVKIHHRTKTAAKLSKVAPKPDVPAMGQKPAKVATVATVAPSAKVEVVKPRETVPWVDLGPPLVSCAQWRDLEFVKAELAAGRPATYLSYKPFAGLFPGVPRLDVMRLFHVKPGKRDDYGWARESDHARRRAVKFGRVADILKAIDRGVLLVGPRPLVVPLLYWHRHRLTPEQIEAMPRRHERDLALERGVKRTKEL